MIEDGIILDEIGKCQPPSPSIPGTPARRGINTPQTPKISRKTIVQPISGAVNLASSQDDDTKVTLTCQAVTPQAPPRDDDDAYRSYGKGLHRRNSMLASETVRTKALDVETTDERMSLNSHEFIVKPWNLSVDTINVSSNAQLTSYNHIKFLCNGKNSNIYKARSGSESIIIKKLAPDCSSDERCRNEFKFEVEFLSRAGACESIVRLLGSGEEKDVSGEFSMPFLVLECLKGGSLTYMLTKRQGFETDLLQVI